ncbi:helix-turn-helix domain-containing protein [Actinacidiphila reveromycinica]|nr:helix-turn-helix domain-containing protein [Streptomyces sp. SN-593]
MARGGSSAADVAGARLAREATASLAGVLAGLGVSQSELARAMSVSPGRVSQIMSGDANLTVRSLAAAAEAIGARVEITFHAPPRDAAVQPRDGAAPVYGSGQAPACR